VTTTLTLQLVVKSKSDEDAVDYIEYVLDDLVMETANNRMDGLKSWKILKIR